MRYLPIILLLTGGIVLTVGDVIMKKWAINPSRGYLLYIWGMAFYLIGLNFLAQSFRYKNIAVASVLLIIINVVSLTIVSWVYFGDKIKLVELVGISLGIMTVLILEFGRS